ncbi:Anthranilate synthase component 1 (plasmid) [Buchnera aphidicola (Tuberolachnus salignus)]|uniref:Anthranilate synthase component 1 n=1 Tax=Buchnera aphidicola subsp. Tuberolachnus salignus TaxID=98804 RepID=A0A170PCC8_BUCTT|nr:anthranilate synthase component 1 [Buchnera aphidicola]CUR53373.1 Anthranilate synthase component 1 [Buchnera aphidicola (Tuberolachnus salignus)]
MLNKNTIQIFTKIIQYQKNPIKTFNTLCKKKKYTLLLESSEKKKQKKSIIIIDSALKIFAEGFKVFIKSLTLNGQAILNLLDKKLPKNLCILKKENLRILLFKKNKKQMHEEESLQSVSIFDSFRLLIKSILIPSQYPYSMFFGGLFSYDLINTFENLPYTQKINQCPDFCFYLAESLLIINHQKKNTILQISTFTKNIPELNRLKKRFYKIQKILKKKLISLTSVSSENISVSTNITDKKFIKIIQNLQLLIKCGEIFQIVPSRKFFIPCKHSLHSYQILKKNNPSPYMFYLQDKNFVLFGASPESFLKYCPNKNLIEIHPIAGTRPRGKNLDFSINQELDNRLELSLRINTKELAEHIMLVDLARNDLAKICKCGSRKVSKLMQIEKYSHVMHLVSKVTGKLKKNLDIFHAYQSCMNMGTLTGAPKIRAMQIIAQIEQTKRGSYGGSIGYFTGLGKLDTSIIIRSAYVENNIATVQAGAGIMFDSSPLEELNECFNKAYVVLLSIFQSCNSLGVLKI